MNRTIWSRKSGQARLQRLWRPPAALGAAMGAGSHCLPAVPSAQPRQAGGQATVEYAIVTGVLIALVVIMALFLTTFGDYGERILAIIVSDYP